VCLIIAEAKLCQTEAFQEQDWTPLVYYLKLLQTRLILGFTCKCCGQLAIISPHLSLNYFRSNMHDGKVFFFFLTVIRTSVRVYKTLAWKGLLFVTNSTEPHFLFSFHLKQTPESFKTLQCLYRRASSQLERSWHCWLQSQQVILFLTISQQNTASSIIVPQTLSSSECICPTLFLEIQ